MLFRWIMISLLAVILMSHSPANAQSSAIHFGRNQVACANGDAHACWEVGLAYEYGDGVDADNVEAVRWFRRAAALGSPEAHMSLGVMYYLGHGVPQNDDEAFGWYNAAVQLGFDGARGPLADMYATGRGVGQDFEMAIRVIEPLAASGNEQAQSYLAYLRSQSPSELIVVPLEDLIVNGSQYHGQEVQTEGFITFEEYAQALFVTEQDYANSTYANSIAISVPAEQMDERELMERTQVRFRGIYDHSCVSELSFCSAHPGYGVLRGYVSVAGGQPDDGNLPSHGDLIPTPYTQLLVADESFDHFDTMVDFAVEVVRAFAEQDQQATENLFPASFGGEVLDDLLAAQGRADFFFFNENAGLISFFQEIGDRLVIAPMRFYDDEMEPIVGAICYSDRNFADGIEFVVSPEAVMFGSQHDPIRCLPVFLDESHAWKIDPYIVTSYAGEHGENLNDSGIQYQLPGPEDGSGRRVELMYHTHRHVPMFPFLHRMRERPRPRSVAAIGDGSFGYSIMFVAPSGQSWRLENRSGEAILTAVD